MIYTIIKYLRAGFILALLGGVFLLAYEVYFVVTNSNRTEFFSEGEPQDMTSGLFSGYIHEDNPDYNKMKAKGSVLTDFDLDGDLDLYYGYEDSWYFENEDGFFTNKTLDYNMDTLGCRGVLAGDVDNNGYPDILKWRFDDELPHNILMNGGNQSFLTHNWLQIEQLPFLHSLGFLDADLDGDLDIVAIQGEGNNQFVLFKNQGIDEFGTPIFQESFTYFRQDEFSSSRALAIADYDNDGDQDIYIARKYGINWLLENQTLTGSPGDVSYNGFPNPIFIERAMERGVADGEVDPELGSMGYGAAWGDYDNDQDFDLYLLNWGMNRLLKNDDYSFTNVAQFYKVESDTLSNGASWGDYNNDGLLDLWSSNIKKQDDVFINLGEGEWDSTYSPVFFAATQDVISADVNNDGWLDVFAAGLKMSDGPSGAKFTSLLYKNITTDSTINTNNWLKIKLEGANPGNNNGGWSNQSNRSAIGARVVLHLSNQDIMREIIGGKGHGNMEPLQLHFGLNDQLTAQGLTIYWPSQDPETNQRKVTYIDGPIDANVSYTYVEDLGFVGKKGDINLDEDVNILDIIIILNHIMDGENPPPAELWAVDLNYSGDLNILDIVRLLNFILMH